MLADLRAAGRLDGVLLDLHGAMVTEGHDDGEGDLIQGVREAVGPMVPIAVTLDFHGNLSEDMVRGADLLHEPIERPWEMLEIRIRDPNGYILAFGQRTSA